MIPKLVEMRKNETTRWILMHSGEALMKSSSDISPLKFFEYFFLFKRFLFIYLFVSLIQSSEGSILAQNLRGSV